MGIRSFETNTPSRGRSTLLSLIFCLMRPFQGETLKQPLELLLWTLICSTLSLGSLLGLLHLVDESFVASISIYEMFVFSLSVSRAPMSG